MPSETYTENTRVITLSKDELIGYILAGLAGDGLSVALPAGGEAADDYHLWTGSVHIGKNTTGDESMLFTVVDGSATA